MTMEVSAKPEVINGGTPLPQRPQKNQIGNKKVIQPQLKQNDGPDGAPAEKKQRFNQGGSNNNSGNLQNKGFSNKGFNNRGNRGGNQNRANFQNRQNQSNQQNQQKDIKPQAIANQDLSLKAEAPQQQQQNQQQQLDQINLKLQNQIQLLNQNQNQNANQTHQSRGGNRGGGGGGGVGGRDGNGRDRDRDGGKRDGGSGGGHRDSFGGGGNRDRSRGGQGGGNFGRNDEFFISQRLRAIAGPTHELPAVESTAEAKFSGRNRLYVGNLTNDVTEDELRELFKPYGEIGEIFSNPDKNFTFLKLDYHANAEKAKRELDGTMRKNRVLRVRFAPNATILRVSNLTQFVSNELLYKAFEIFGPVERANIIVDDRGKHTGEGIVEFGKKSSANCCMRYCNDKCFFLTASLRPCVVENFEVNDDADGLPDKTLNKKSPEFNHERSVGPRFAETGSFEHEYGTRWKQMHELYKTKQDALKRELKMEEEKLEAQMEYARYEHETELLRQELRKRESDNERKKIEWELREKQAEEMLKRDEDNMRRQQTEMQTRMLRQEEEMRRRQQENTLFMQAQQLNSLLDQQEGFNSGGVSGNNANNFDNFGGASNSPFEFRGNTGAIGTGGGNSGQTNAQETFSFEYGGNNQNQGGQGNQRGGTTGGNPNNNNNPWERRRRF